MKREFPARLVRVVDGDTLVVDFDLGFHITSRQHCRLRGIDTPEIFRPSSAEEKERGLAAKRFVENWFFNRIGKIRIVSHELGKYGRPIVDLYHDGENLADALKAAGFDKNNG